MAVLEKLRVKCGLAISIIIAIGLLSFIIDPNEVISAFNGMSSKYDVGEINGKSVSYNNFQEDVERFTTINELMYGSVKGNEQQAQIREAAWQDLIYKYLVNVKADEAGLTVGKEEMIDLTSGNNLSPLIAQNPAFMDQNGNFSKENLVNFVSNINADETGRLRLYWNYLQNSIYNQQIYTKYTSLFTQSGYTTPLMLKKMVEENNNTANVEFVMVPYGYVPDSTVTVSDSEIKAYYKNHKKFYKQNASRDIEYVVFEVKPSATDIAAQGKKISDIYEEFSTTDNMKAFLMKNSDRAFEDVYYKEGDLKTVSSEVEDFVWKGNGEVSQVIESGTKFYVVRVLESAKLPESVEVSHILLQGDNAEQQADSLIGVLNHGESFANVASLYSADQQSAVDGKKGNLGWMSYNNMIAGFEPALSAQKNKPFKVKTAYGTHILVVTDAKDVIPMKKVAVLYKETLAGKETFNSFYAQANKFATIANGSYDNYKAAVDTMGVYSHPLNNMVEGNEKLGSIDNAKEVTRWAFDNKVGKVSNIITVDNNFFVIATVKGIHKDGYAKVSEVASTIQQQLYHEKLGAKKAADIAAQIEGLTDLNAIAEKLGTTVSSQSDVAFSSLNAQRLDPAFIGAVSVAQEGQISKPVVGSIGVYVFKVTGHDTGAFYTEDDAKVRQSQVDMYTAQMIVPVMMQDADVKDNRGRFY